MQNYQNNIDTRVSQNNEMLILLSSENCQYMRPVKLLYQDFMIVHCG